MGRGFSLGAVVTGLFVAIGAMMVATLTGSLIFSVLDIDGARLLRGQDVKAALAWAAAIVASQFFPFLWGGYAAGRMAGTKGLLHGLLVPIFAIAAAAGVIAAYSALQDRIQPIAQVRAVFEGRDFSATPFNVAVGGGLLVVVILAGMFGGVMGGRWLEREEGYYAESPREFWQPPDEA